MNEVAYYFDSVGPDVYLVVEDGKRIAKTKFLAASGSKPKWIMLPGADATWTVTGSSRAAGHRSHRCVTADVPRFATYLNTPDEGFGNRLARVLFELATYVRGNNAEWQKAMWSAGESLAVLEASRDCYLRTHGRTHAVVAEALQQIIAAPRDIKVFTTHRPNHHSGRGDVLNLRRGWYRRWRRSILA